MTLQGLRRGAGLGVVLGAGYITQTYGLRFASATVSGFITGMFVVLTPVISWLILGKKVNRNTILAVVLATLGLALLSLHGWSVGTGELLTLACAVFFAVHIVGLGEWSAKYDLYGFALLQIATVAVIALLAASPGGIKTATGREHLGYCRDYRGICDCRGFPGADMDTVAGAGGNCGDYHDNGTCFCRHFWRIFR